MHQKSSLSKSDFLKKTSCNSRLPNVLVLALPKTGSTSLYHTFANHPDICLPNAKETWFFDQFWNKGIKWYEEKFLHCSGESIRCDYASTLMYHEGFTQKLIQAIPEARFIVLLRDPVERALSHYFHEVRRGDEKESFEQAIRLENDRINSMPAKYSHIAYRDIGRIYKLRIDELMSVFPYERLYFILLEEILSSPVYLQNLWNYLGVAPCIEDFEKRNSARLPRNRTMQKILGIPGAVFSMIQASSFLNSVTSSATKQKTRRFRGQISALLSSIAEMSYKEVKKPDIPDELLNDLVACYNENLKGLDKTIGKDLSEFWPWYGSK